MSLRPSNRQFIEVDHYQERKHNQAACGDVFLSQKSDGGDRVISVLADGLGSGIKAMVLAQLTTTMAAKYVAGDVDMAKAAEIIMATLPVCSERQIAYSTFTIVDMDRRGETQILEYDNPGFVLLRGTDVVEVPKTSLPLKGAGGREAILYHARFRALPGDRIVVFSDGVTQAGVGQRGTPLGWGQAAVREYLQGVLRDRGGISARQLGRALVQRAVGIDGQKAKDDTTCGVIYFRRPREVMVFTGAPVQRSKDQEVAQMARDFEGRKVICGGTTASLLSRELGRELSMKLDDLDPDVPPVSAMEGFDLVTEGALTLAHLARILESEARPESLKPNAATRLAGVLLESDLIRFVVGTKINEALQDPNLPQELDIRRNLIRRLERVLSSQYLKEVQVRFI